MNYEAAAIIARYEQEAISRRADVAAALGGLPALPLLPLFRRRTLNPLTAAVEVRHARAADDTRIDRRLQELAVPVTLEKKAS
ncbi:MAG: hypothetical protein IT301_05045 [Dehalococcoidia bacterium]|nr:hypothetical protein [Dehalococcoidia bacterium]